MQLRKIEHLTSQKLLKRGGYIQKAGHLRPLLPHTRLRLIPDVFYRVLAGVMWGNPATGDRPVLFGHSNVHLGEIRPDRPRFVVAGIVPDDTEYEDHREQI